MENHIVKQRPPEMETANGPNMFKYGLESDQDSSGMLFVDSGGSSIGSGN